MTAISSTLAKFRTVGVDHTTIESRFTTFTLTPEQVAEEARNQAYDALVRFNIQMDFGGPQMVMGKFNSRIYGSEHAAKAEYFTKHFSLAWKSDLSFPTKMYYTIIGSTADGFIKVCYNVYDGVANGLRAIKHVFYCLRMGEENRSLQGRLFLTNLSKATANVKEFVLQALRLPPLGFGHLFGKIFFVIDGAILSIGPIKRFFENKIMFEKRTLDAAKQGESCTLPLVRTPSGVVLTQGAPDRGFNMNKLTEKTAAALAEAIRREALPAHERASLEHQEKLVGHAASVLERQKTELLDGLIGAGHLQPNQELEEKHLQFAMLGILDLLPPEELDLIRISQTTDGSTHDFDINED